MEFIERIGIAENLKTRLLKTVPVADWGFTVAVWAPDGGNSVRVYVNDKKRKTAAIAIVDPDGFTQWQWQPGHSMTRDAIKAAGVAK
jgi:hypothetical protein